MIFGCCCSSRRIPQHAVVTVYNESNYLVRDITILNGVDPETLDFPTLSQLGVGDRHRFEVVWWVWPNEKQGYVWHITYRINDKEFWVKHEEGVRVDSVGIFYSPQVLLDGSHSHIFIRNEGYKIIIENGGTMESSI